MNGRGRCRVIVMAKAPVAGLAKTRLAGVLGAAGAAQLAARMLRETVAQALAAGLGPVELCAAPAPDHPAVHAALGDWAGRLDTSAQGEGDLGARMQRALERGLALDGRALLIGTDCPGLDAARLVAAAAALDGHDAVFVPALDGGYVLVGMRRPVADLLSSMPWSTPEVMARTRDRLAAAGIDWAELPALADIDEPADLARLPPGWCNPPFVRND
jgi:uncharacterized protein